MPLREGLPPIPDSKKDKMMHVSLPISKEIVLMDSDSLNAFGQPVVADNNFSISINTDSTQEANRFFKEFSGGGKVAMPMNQTFRGAYFGMLTDRFGINWMINVDLVQKN